MRRLTYPNEPQAPTPHYTNAMVEDMYMKSHMTHLHRAITHCGGLSAGIILAKVHCYQHQIHVQATTVLERASPKPAPELRLCSPVTPPTLLTLTHAS